MRSTRAVIDLQAIADNAKYLQEHANRDIICIIKADAYGHGVIPVLNKLYKEDFRFFGVATFEEAMELRKEKDDVEILVIGDTPVEDFEEASKHGISVAIHNEHGLENALKTPGLKCHLKVDTGMHRIGFQVEQLPHYLDQILTLKPLGMFTHIARADEIDKAEAMKQVNRFKEAYDLFQKANYVFKWVHFENSASILEIDPDFSNLVRGGICLYGLNPSDEVVSNDIKPALSWYTQIVDLRDIEIGEGVSYSHIFKASKPTRVATLPVGYADGYKRQMSGKAHVYLNGKCVPVIGRITMDQIMIDVSDVDCKLLDEVELLGEHITADDQAKWADTINYEIVTTLGKRVRREYIGE